jgi:hypothetical protein
VTAALDPALCAQLIHCAKPWRWSVDRPPVSMSIDDAAGQLATQLEAAIARISALETHQQDHLALIAKLTSETPYPVELEECRWTLIAEVGTLRTRITGLEAGVARHVADAAASACRLDQLEHGVARRDRSINALTARVAEVIANRDRFLAELIAARALAEASVAVQRMRIAELEVVLAGIAAWHGRHVDDE